MNRPIVITGGGTGGHIFPMVAIAEALLASGETPLTLRYVGSRRGQEGDLLGSGPIPLTLLPGRGIRRSLHPRTWRTNAGAIVALVVAVVRAWGLVARWRPRCVVSVGGYASFAVSLAAVVWRRPLVLVDLDATPPATHRVLARFAATRCVSFGPPSAHTVVTGAPVRTDIVAIDRSAAARLEARAALSTPIERQRNVIVVMTGSLGAGSVNRAVVDLAHQWRDRPDIALIHITGRRDVEWVRAAAPVGDVALDYRVEAFGDMTRWWPVADVALCRAGATTVAELTVMGIPAVLVPLPGAPGDHQSVNAQALVDANAALIVRDQDVSATTLDAAFAKLLAPDVATTMATASRGLGHPNAASAIAQAVLSVVRGSDV